MIIDLYNREIIGFSCGFKKDTALVKQALSTIKAPLTSVSIFHTDRGKEFDNQQIEQILSNFKINRSLSHPGCPYDNAVAEATYKSFKVEFIGPNKFNNLEQLTLELSDYVHWWNNHRYHSTLGYESPVTYRLKNQVYTMKETITSCTK